MKKSKFAVKILLEYAKENGINGRDTTDLSPLEEWLILRLYNDGESFSKADLLDLGSWFDSSPEFVEEVVNDWLNSRQQLR